MEAVRISFRAAPGGDPMGGDLRIFHCHRSLQYVSVPIAPGNEYMFFLFSWVVPPRLPKQPKIRFVPPRRAGKVRIASKCRRYRFWFSVCGVRSTDPSQHV